MSYRKLGKPTDQRMAMLRNQVSELLWLGRIETTLERAKEVRRLAEKLLTLAINTHEDTVKVTKQVKVEKLVKSKDKDAKKVKTYEIKPMEFTNDGPRKLAARRKIMANTRDLQELRQPRESRTAYKIRTGDINHPLIEKIFNELAPKYQARAEEKGQGGGYTRIVKLGARPGDRAEMAVLELV